MVPLNVLQRSGCRSWLCRKVATSRVRSSSYHSAPPCLLAGRVMKFTGNFSSSYARANSCDCFLVSVRHPHQRRAANARQRMIRLGEWEKPGAGNGSPFRKSPEFAGLSDRALGFSRSPTFTGAPARGKRTSAQALGVRTVSGWRLRWRRLAVPKHLEG